MGSLKKGIPPDLSRGRGDGGSAVVRGAGVVEEGAGRREGSRRVDDPQFRHLLERHDLTKAIFEEIGTRWRSAGCRSSRGRSWTRRSATCRARRRTPRLRTAASGGAVSVRDTSSSPRSSAHPASVDIGVEDGSKVTPDPDPRHRSFYEVWESTLGLADAEVDGLDSRRKAVFYVGLLEAEVMNGGLGQYLSNTDGAHLDATLRCLAEIGALRRAALLAEAARVGARAESSGAAWEEVLELMTLYPQPVQRQGGGAEYLPGPRQRETRRQ